MEVGLLNFVEQCCRLVKQALGKHVVLHCLRLEDGHSYRETPNRLKNMVEIRDALGLDRDDLPYYSTIYKSFDRLKMWVWQALLRITMRVRLHLLVHFIASGGWRSTTYSAAFGPREYKYKNLQELCKNCYKRGGRAR